MEERHVVRVSKTVENAHSSFKVNMKYCSQITRDGILVIRIYWIVERVCIWQVAEAEFGHKSQKRKVVPEADKDFKVRMKWNYRQIFCSVCDALPDNPNILFGTCTNESNTLWVLRNQTGSFLTPCSKVCIIHMPHWIQNLLQPKCSVTCHLVGLSGDVRLNLMGLIIALISTSHWITIINRVSVNC